MATVTLIKRASSKGSLQNVSESADAAALSAIERTTGGVAALWADANTTAITIGGGAAQTSVTIGRAGQDTSVLGDLQVEERLFGPSDGTGLVVGVAGAGASTGSALQVASFTAAERDNLVAANGMVIYNSTAGVLQVYFSGAWNQLPIQATETLAGIAEIATQAEVTTGTDDLRFVTPLKLAVELAASSGPVTELVSAVTVDTTMSITPSLIDSMSVVPAGGPGTYLVFFFAEATVDKNARFAEARIRFNGVDDTNSLRAIGGQAGNIGTFASAAEGTVAASQAIDVYWNLTNVASAPTATITGRSLVLIKVG